MRKYKLLAADMDGTLLNDKKEITPKTLASINRMISNGGVFCLSTGRPLIGVLKYCEQIKGNIPLILYNGAIVRFSKDSAPIVSRCLSKSQSESILSVIKQHNGIYIFWSNEKVYASVINDITIKYFAISGATPILIDDSTVIPHGEIIKIIWFDDNAKLKEYQATLLKELKDVNYFTSQPTFLEFVSKGISKAEAMEILGRHCNIDRSEMIAVGDGCNDIPMLEYAGLGVAMENAEEEVKQICSEITSNNEEDGVGLLIDKYFN